MNLDKISKPLPLRNISIADDFWSKEMELVRTEVIPYQWNALNDNVPGANPSFCMRNFKVAGQMNRLKEELGDKYVAPKYTYKGFEALPEDINNPDDDKFYGFVFQDTDFSKWIEAVAYSLTQHPDSELEETADAAIDIVCAAQQEDGYLDTYYIINGRDMEFTNLRDHHELYCFGHLTEGAVAYYQATGKDKLLNAAKRFADYLISVFGREDGKIKGYPGHEIAEMALIRLCEVTGDNKYYELAKFFIDERGVRPYYYDSEDHPEVVVKGHENEERYSYQQAHKPVREQDEAVGHAVRAVYLYSGMADVARISQDEELYEACNKLWDNIVNKKMYITGGIGATHMGEAFSFNYDLPNDTAYAETCASIGMAFFARRMLEIRPDSVYGDIIEREMYNGILSGMALDGKSFFYVNPLEVNPIACRTDERKKHVKPVRQKWFGCACCPPNLARFISSIGEYAYTESDSTLYIHQYIGAQIKAADSGDGVDIKIDSQFPWNGRVRINADSKGRKYTLALRIPGWCDGEYTLTGYEGDMDVLNGYLYLTRVWRGEDQLQIEFPMDVKICEADSNVRENIGKAAVMRGPIVYCLEEADNGANLHLLKLASDSDVKIEELDIQGNKAKKIIARGIRQAVKTADSLYKLITPNDTKNVGLTFIPYYMWANRGENEMQVWTDVI